MSFGAGWHIGCPGWRTHRGDCSVTQRSADDSSLKKLVAKRDTLVEQHRLLVGIVSRNHERLRLLKTIIAEYDVEIRRVEFRARGHGPAP